MSIGNKLAGVKETEEDRAALRVVEVLAPRLLLAIETAPTLPELIGILEDFKAGMQCAARRRCEELRQSIQNITEEINP